jgi:hypothetical protein
MVEQDDTDRDVTPDEISAIFEDIRTRAVRLLLTTRAARMNRRTPAEVQALMDRAERARRRSQLLRRLYTQRKTVH